MYTPKFQITNNILKNIGVIEACKEVIDHAPLIPAYEKKFREEAMVRIVHYGTHIEGNQLDLAEAEQVLAGRKIEGRERDIREVINYRKVVEYIGQSQSANLKAQNYNANVKTGIDEALIKKIHSLTVHKILDPNKVGKYRETQVVVKSNQTGEVSFRPPQAQALAKLMEDFILWLNSDQRVTTHTVLRSGIVHYELVRIHPFLDGNGRVARALSMLVLFQEGYDIRRFFSLEEYFDSDPVNYYQALASVEKTHGDLTFWLEYFTNGLAIELTKIKEKIQKLSIDMKLKERLGGQIALSERQIKIIEYLQEIGFLQNQTFASLFPMVSEDTILRELKDLMKKKIIKRIGKTKAARYIISGQK